MQRGQFLASPEATESGAAARRCAWLSSGPLFAPRRHGVPEQHSGAVHALEYGFAGPDIRRPASGARIGDAPSEKGTSMPVVPMQEILKDAFDRRYGVGAFNIVNDLTMDAVLSAA